MGFDILVDGYNVIKNNLMFQMVEAKNLAEARNILIKQLKNRYRNTAYRVVVVFDGNDAREQTMYEDHICIIFSRHGETADRVIARLAAEAHQKGTGVALYSDDGEVKHNVTEQGGSAHTTHQLTQSLNAAPRDIAIRSQHRQAMRRVYGIDPAYKAEDENPSPGYRGRKKKGKSSRRHKPY
ncbi:MAG: NYN domain-containing protein [Ktedonobacteraceae bacterium]|nr:NYN domain-containing protein [Ktedonobacteraceae bacterium]